MKRYLLFLRYGLILGLFTEILLKLVAGIKPEAIGIALVFYPVLLTIAFTGSELLSKIFKSQWLGDLVHYFLSGVFGLGVEWALLGNGPGSNALQFGMFAMWTTFCFGPHILLRLRTTLPNGAKWFWRVFWVASVPLTVAVAAASGRDAKVVTAVYGLSYSYSVWSIWLLFLAWRQRPEIMPDAS